MSDRSINSDKEQSLPTIPESDAQKTLIQHLHKARPSENISIISINKDQSEKLMAPMLSLPQVSNVKIETVFNKLEMNGEKSDSASDLVMIDPEKQAELKEKLEVKESPLKVDRNSSDILGMKDILNFTNDIYSVSGVPSRRLYKNRDFCSSIFPVGTMGCREEDVVQQPSRRFLNTQQTAQNFFSHLNDMPRKSTNNELDSSSRNPVTGAGFDVDAGKTAGTRRKDGNPVLGLGYDDEPLSQRKANPNRGHNECLW